jgi:hypothetical protein
MRAWTLWHRVLDEVPLADGRTKYLSPCHHWNSEGYVNRPGAGLQARVPSDEAFCMLCDQADNASGSAAAPATWTAMRAPRRDGVEQVHLLRDRAWHLIADGGPVEAVEMGTLFLTECGWWIESGRVRSQGTGGPRSPVCEACVRFVDARATGNLEL